MVILGFVGVALAVLVWTMPGGRVVEVEAEENQPFELRHTTLTQRKFRLCAKLRYHTGGGGGTSGRGGGPDEGLECDLHVTADGFHKTRKGAYVLVEIPRCPAGAEIVARGTFRPGELSETSMLDVFLGR